MVVDPREYDCRVADESTTDEPEIIDADIPCVMCGYVLRGLPEDARCPECGAPAKRSLMGDLLRYSTDAYLETIQRGGWLIVATAIAGIALGLLQVVLSFTPIGNVGGGQTLIAVTNLGFAILVGIELIGWWMFSSADESVKSGRTGTRARYWIRGAVIALGVTSALDAGLTLWSPGGFTGAWVTIYNAVESADFIATVIRFFAAMTYIRWLVMRIPDPELDSTARTYRWLCPIFVICLPIAIILYLTLIFRVQKAIRTVRFDETRADELAAMG